jgi:hypothetical protein
VATPTLPNVRSSLASPSIRGRRVQAATEDGLDAVRSAPGIRALFAKEKLDEARRQLVADGGAR